jgi:hypothetical protein
MEAVWFIAGHGISEALSMKWTSAQHGHRGAWNEEQNSTCCNRVAFGAYPTPDTCHVVFTHIPPEISGADLRASEAHSVRYSASTP